MLAGIVCAAPDIGITMREGGIVRGDACILAMDFETGIADDLSGKGNDGTVIGATFVAATGLSSGAVRFDGVNDYISIDDHDTIEELSEITLSAWAYFKVQSQAAEDTIFDKWGFGKKGLQLRYDSANNQIDFFVGKYSDSAEVSNGVSVEGGWHHVCATWDTTSNKMKVYVDGEKLPNEGTFSAHTTIIYKEDDLNLWIGEYHGAPRRDPFKGSIDEVLIYNDSLTASEVKDLYRSGMIRHPNP